jgi:beta-N-acetylhexosaminidase
MNACTGEAAGGRILIGIPGLTLEAADREALMHPVVGGVVLFSRNYDSPEQLLELVRAVRRLREPRLLVCIDQEGGRVQRLRAGYTRLPPLGALGRLHREDPQKALDLAYRHGRVMATEVLASGIDLSFAPVLDLDRGSAVIGDRAFSAAPEVVERLGRSYLGGMHDAGMKTTGKHFPGHGSVVADSHVADVLDARPLADIEASDLLPFRGLAPLLDAVMIAHVVYPSVDRRPAGYSARWLQDILRGRLGYRGVILSDDLGMHAARTAGDVRQRARASLQAGCDLVLVCHPEEVAALLGGEIDPSLCERSLAASRLYGQPTLDAGELRQVVQEGIREWPHWQSSLEELT